MADFCAGCTVVLFAMPAEQNDFNGWLSRAAGDAQLRKTNEYEWSLCEGCGHHAFNDFGRRRCGAEDLSVPGRVAWTWCESCQEILGV